MKLGEALTLRKDLIARFNSILALIKANVVIEKDDKPEVDINSLQTEAENLLNQRFDLIRRINRTNQATKLPGTEMTIADAIVLRDQFKAQKEYATQTAAFSKGRRERGSYGDTSVVEYVSLLNANEFRARADETAKAFRELDVALQAANWSTDLLD